MGRPLVAVVVLAALGPACGGSGAPVPGDNCGDGVDDGTPIRYETKPAGSLSSLPPAAGGMVLAGRYHLTDETVWPSVLPCEAGVHALSATKVVTLTSNEGGTDDSVFTFTGKAHLYQAHAFEVHDTRMERTTRQCVFPGSDPAGVKTTRPYTADGAHLLFYYDRSNEAGSCGVLVQTFTRQAPTSDAL
jgi:hypothetical protein